MKEQRLGCICLVVSSSVWGYGLFWSWNLIFLAFMFLGFGPQMLPELLNAVTLGAIPMQFLVLGIILVAIPVIAVILGLTFLRRSPGGLLTLWYAIEAPLMLIVALRFFAFRDLVPAVALLMITVALGMTTLLWQLVDKHIDARGAVLTRLRVIGLSILVIVAVYCCLWIAFYVLPVGAFAWNAFTSMLQSIWNSIVRFSWRDLLLMTYATPFMLLGIVLMLYTATLFIGAPIVVPILVLRAWWRGMRAMIARDGMWRTIGSVTVVLIAFVVLFVQANQQPQRAAFALLKNPPATVAEAQSLHNQEETIRAGLLNTYLAAFRYISAVGEVRHVSDMYEWSFHLPKQDSASIERAYETVARPLLYEPVNPTPADNRMDGRALREEPPEAAKLYKAYFDQRIIDGEHDTIVNAVRSTWSATQAEAAWQAVDDRKIRLTRQEITVAERGDWAEVELYEVYQNQTNVRQEVIYYFSLPESAVVTGLWLGNSEDRAARYAYRVAPRGAAQAVYRNEVRRNMDPALIEQIGPRQYRLRIFPVEPRRWSRDYTTNRSSIVDGPPLHVWLTFRVFASDNAWAMPHLAEKRNVYWDATTTRIVNGTLRAANANATDWLPASVAAIAPIKPAAHRTDFPGGVSVLVRPLAANVLPQLPSNLRLAVVLDRSRSMSALATDVKATFARLSQVAGATMDVYLTSSQYHGEAPSRISLNQFHPDKIEYAGGQNAGELLAQFDSLRAGQTYDAIFVVTDGSGYELGESTSKIAVSNAPVWMVHLGGNLPLGYDDATLEAIQASGGGAASNIEEALNRLAVALNPKGLVLSDATAGAITDWVDGYTWYALPTETIKEAGSVDNNFAPFAARRLILAETQRQRGALVGDRASSMQLQTLDQLHAIAVKHSVVTPYSSMIVLVNSGQEQLLNQLESNSDRFQREMEDVADTVGTNPFSVTGVPEPEEWLLIAVAAAMLLGYGYVTQIAPRRRIRAG